MGISTVGSEILVTTGLGATATKPLITKLAGGGFVVTWTDYGATGGDTSNAAVRAHVYSANGTAVSEVLLVNTATSSNQFGPAVAALSGGGFVVTWTDNSRGDGGATGDSDNNAVKGQVFSAAGAPVGSEFLVNTTTIGSQASPQVSALANDGFVVTWVDASHTGVDTDGSALRAQVFGAGATPVGGEFLVNTTTPQDQNFQAVITLSNGGFVVAWRDLSQTGGDTSGGAVRAQVFAADGSTVGTEFLVNTSTNLTQEGPLLTALSGGGFVATWPDKSVTAPDTSEQAVRAQVFAADGSRVGTEILVNTATDQDQYVTGITSLSNGGFVITWGDYSQTGGDTSNYAVRAQLFAADGTRVGSEILVNTITEGSQWPGNVVAIPGGGFVIAWADGSQTAPDTSGTAVRAQAFNADGTRLGGELLVNTTTANYQLSPNIAPLSNGFAVSWLDAASDEDLGAVRAQVFSTGAVAPTLAGAGGTTAFVEGSNVTSTPVAVAASLTVTDDGSTLASGAVSITGGFHSGEDVLAFANAAGMGNIAGSYNATTGVLTLTSAGATATLAQWQAALRSVTYTNNSDTPDTSDRTISFVVNDGALDATAATQTVSVTAVDDPPPAPAPPPAPLVDGTPVTTVVSTDAQGQATHTITVPTIGMGRPDTVGNNNLADIPLVRGPDPLAPPLLSVQAPAGVALTARGPAAAGTAGNALADLIREIETHTPGGSADRTLLTSAGGGFLSSLPTSAPLLVQTVAPSGGGGTGSAPLVINGAATAENHVLTALVIDARGLSSGTPLQLNNVEFATVIGNAIVTGGAGAQTVWGDGANQYLFLGADDDVLHGGGGSDTVASAGGDDRLYGDEGDDSVSGGVGDDVVHGNAGADTVSGGEGDDRAYGGQGNDHVTGDAGDDMVFGDLGDDFLHGNAGADTLDGGAGADTVHGGQDHDQITGGQGDDTVLGDAGDDFVQGGQGNDLVFGGEGNDVLHGGQGDDVISGGDGDDWLSGDKGDDTLTGGSGADSFHGYLGCGAEVVTDFNAAEGDRIVLDSGTPCAVAQLAEGVLINIAEGDYMLLRGVQLSSLGEGWLVGG